MAGDTESVPKGPPMTYGVSNGNGHATDDVT